MIFVFSKISTRLVKRILRIFDLHDFFLYFLVIFIYIRPSTWFSADTRDELLKGTMHKPVITAEPLSVQLVKVDIKTLLIMHSRRIKLGRQVKMCEVDQ